MLFLFSRYLSSLLDFLVMQEKRLDQKDKVNFKMYDVTTWLRNNCNTHIPHISLSKGNKAMKFGQLIEYNKKIIALQKLCRKCGKETSFTSFFIF